MERILKIVQKTEQPQIMLSKIKKSFLSSTSPKERKLNNYHISKATKSTSLTLVFLELQGVVLRQTIAKSVLLFTYEKWHLFNLRS